MKHVGLLLDPIPWRHLPPPVPCACNLRVLFNKVNNSIHKEQSFQNGAANSWQFAEADGPHFREDAVRLRPGSQRQFQLNNFDLVEV